ncbi:MAG: hypothetical protein KGI29_02140 [Pseudomonadota bacterium]|nr:hypothetical protein [Pseudomonadota bacterium]MDE3037432.1 hypothetical protein [Pseudomonadota bacterium]
MFGHIFQSRKERKKAQIKKNRYHEEIFQLLRLRRAEETRVKGLESKHKSKASHTPDSEVADKVARIRNRLTGQRRVSRERWNRFAGTGGEGGRGL